MNKSFSKITRPFLIFLVLTTYVPASIACNKMIASTVTSISTQIQESRANLDDMNYIILDGSKPFRDQVQYANSIFEIRTNFNLQGKTVTLPSGCVLNFMGGSLSNGSLICNDTYMEGYPRLYCNVKGLIANPEVNVRWFGAKGDNKTDDTDAIQRAVEALCGNTLVFGPSPSYYYITNTIRLTQQKNRPNTIAMSFVGNQGSAIRIDDGFKAGELGPVFLLSNVSAGYTIDGLSIYGTGKNIGIGIKMQGSCRDIRINDFFASGLYSAVETDKGNYYNYLSRFHFYRCKFGLKITGGSPQGALKVDAGKISGCEYGVYSDANCNDVVINSVTLEADAYKVYVTDGGIILNNPYMGDASVCNVYITGGEVFINHPTSPIGGAGSGDYKLDDNQERYGIVQRGGNLKIADAYLEGNFTNRKGDGYNVVGSSVLYEGGIFDVQNVTFSQREQNPLKITASADKSNINMPKLKNHVKNGCFTNEQAYDESFKSSHSGDCGCSYSHINEPNGMGGNILRVSPPQREKMWGIRFPYEVSNTDEVMYLRIKMRYSRDYSKEERSLIDKNTTTAICVDNGKIFSWAEASNEGYHMSYPINTAWYGYTPIVPAPSSFSGYPKSYEVERVLPVKLENKTGYIEVIFTQDKGPVCSAKNQRRYLV